MQRKKTRPVGGPRSTCWWAAWPSWRRPALGGDNVGTREALYGLASEPFGPWLLGGLALGLASHGLYWLINAFFGDTSID
ncbi:DUF1206 domain-containing protein [Halomonas maura]|uniref:DUF1206 domain-containing protein n=1 Tax=Halomonas maura TaxID=117606 RepID=UPI0025B5E931|nr:DUF1206 domain-containing protein [Halomonas maura]MDN3554481.1 DUF1206 domain-containing protein [Halomonas maura]